MAGSAEGNRPLRMMCRSARMRALVHDHGWRGPRPHPMMCRSAGMRAEVLSEHALRVMLADRVDAAVQAAKAKLFTQRLAFETADAAVQIHGGAGYMSEYPAQRWLR